ncbi:MAG TPA: maleylpyruvate isomerase family mycothiol-dependent enzyme [Ilumatobacteraceae bacterium]|nr:maleylpyruvate isomerase family mycothiol-dependent enzyme [Ilumatobacteraceae bacterium]
MSETFDIEARYLFAQQSFAEMARGLSDDDWATPMPCTPEWTVRDALSHVAGIPDDALAGRMDGAPGEAWTAAQIERNRSLQVDELLDRWDTQTPVFADVLQQMGEGRPPFDCHTHEHDVRQALGRPGDRSSVLIEAMAAELAAIDDSPVSLTVELVDGRMARSGPSEAASAVTLSGITAFDLFRSRPGRRSRQQVRAWNWSGADADIETVIDHWFVFGPATDPIIE